MVNSMDCNRDEAVRCCEIGREHIRHGRRAEALKMFKKSEALYPNTDASTWIQQLESATTTPTSSPSNTSTPPSSTNSRPSRLKLVDSLYRQYDFLAKNVAMFVNQIEPAHRKPLLFLLVVIVILLACRILVGSPRFLFQYFGQLPGDISYQSGTVSVYFPIVSYLFLSAGISIILNLLRNLS